MKKMIWSGGVAGLFLSSMVLATPTVTISTPTPAIAPFYYIGTNTVITYTLSNYVPRYLPLSITGVSPPIRRVTVANDCGSVLPSGNPAHPATCQIGLAIAPTTADAGTPINQTFNVNYQGRTPVSSTISANIISYVFATTGTYQGQLGGVLGADAICQSEAYQLNSVLPPGLRFKALLVSPTRYPCDATGLCGNNHASDWPLMAGQVFYNPDNTLFNQVNSNYVFDGTANQLMTSLGTFAPTEAIWSGVQSILSNGFSDDITAWAYADVNPGEDASFYGSNLATCKGWTSAEGIIPNVRGSTGQIGQTNGSTGVPPNTWGNYYCFSDTLGCGSYIYNMWVNSGVKYCDEYVMLACISY